MYLRAFALASSINLLRIEIPVAIRLFGCSHSLTHAMSCNLFMCIFAQNAHNFRRSVNKPPQNERTHFQRLGNAI